MNSSEKNEWNNEEERSNYSASTPDAIDCILVLLNVYAYIKRAIERLLHLMKFSMALMNIQ